MPTNIKVMTYNIQLGAGSNSMARYIYDWLSVSLAIPHSAKNIETIIENIKAVSPDILTVTESEGPSARSMWVDYNKMIKKGCSLEYGCFQVHEASSGSKGMLKLQNNAIFVKPEHEMTERAAFYFTESEQRRCIGRADINIKKETGYLPVSVFNMHLSVSQKYRPKQIKEALKFIEEREGLKMIMGDFNIKGDESELNPIKEKYKEIISANGAPYLTWHSWGNPKYPMDRIFVSKEFDIVNSFAPKVRGSDHLPLVAILRY